MHAASGQRIDPDFVVSKRDLPVPAHAVGDKNSRTLKTGASQTFDRIGLKSNLARLSYADGLML